MKTTNRDIRKIQSIINKNDMDAYIGTLDGETMLILSSNKEEEMIQKHFKRKLWNVIESGYDDEYTTCSGCGNIIRTSPTHYGWKADYLITECEIFCKDCINFEMVEVWLDHDVKRANTIYSSSELIAHGYEQYNTYHYETGFHSGMNDTPAKVYEEVKDKYDHVIFHIHEQSQFYTKWDVYVKNDEKEEEE